VTSVSRVEADNTDEIFPRIFPFLSDGRSPISRSKRMKGFRDRSLLFLSRAIIRLKAFGFRTTHSSGNEPSGTASNVTLLMPERRACTISSASLLFLGIGPGSYSCLRLLLFGGEVNLNTKGRMLRFARLFLELISRRRSVPLIVVAVSGSSTAVHQCS
jgi:hypothetical protein